MLVLNGAGRTDVGLKRRNNEDSLFIDQEIGLFLVADGMGGAAGGEIASRLVAETVGAYVRKYLDKPADAPLRFDFNDPNLSPRANTLLQAVFLANKLVYDQARSDPAYKGMGSTLAVILPEGGELLAASVGDSRIFRSRNGKLERLTVDHRLSDDPQFHGLIDPEGTIMTTMGHTLTRAMGVNEEVKPDLKRWPLQDGDVFLLASDGLSDMVPEEMIAKVLDMGASPERKTKDLIDLALAGGGKDNVTVIVVEARTGKKLKNFLSKLTGGG